MEVVPAAPQVEKEEVSSSTVGFDPTKKKKKKKVRLPTEEEGEAAEKLQSLSVTEAAPAPDPMFAGLKKKPKKAKKPVSSLLPIFPPAHLSSSRRRGYAPRCSVPFSCFDSPPQAVSLAQD